MAANSILHCCSTKQQETIENAHAWYPKKRGEWGTIHEENDIIKTEEELANVKRQLKQGKHTCLVIRMEYPRAYEIH